MAAQQPTEKVERTDTGVSISVDDDKPWKDAELVNRLYHEENLSGPKIADVLGCSVGPIYDRIEDVRSFREANKIWQLKMPARFTTDRDGYERVGTKIDGENKTIAHHRLVAIAEYGSDSVKGKIVHHKNGIPWDNRPENLELMSQSDHVREHFEEIPPAVKKDIYDRSVHGDETHREIADSLGMLRTTVCTIVARIKRGEYNV